MTVWTEVSLHEVNEWLVMRGFDTARALSAVEEGVEDSVYRVEMADGSRRCLRLFERTEAQGPLELATCLAARGLPTCAPLRAKDGTLSGFLNGKPAALFPWIDGKWAEKPSLAQIAEVGRFLGSMAREGVVHCSTWHREDPRPWPWFEHTAFALQEVLSRDVAIDIADEVAAHKSYWQSEVMSSLPRGPIHADLFRNNVMFDARGKLEAVLDWGFCASGGLLVYDLAISANDWCLEEGSFELDPLKLEALLRGREAVLPLCKEEREAWPMALRLAALRFYLSRLFDRYLPREPNGRSHDPEHFGAILRARKARV